VSASGVATSMAKGMSTITVTTIECGFTAICAVKVLPAGTVLIDVTDVSVSPTSMSMNPCNTHKLTVTVTPQDATIRDIS